MKTIERYGVSIVKDGQTVRTSRNLRAMRDYARVSPVAEVHTRKDPQYQCRGLLQVKYADGAESTASFASFHIMIDFVRNRRTWRGARTVHADGDQGYLTAPGILA